MSARIESCNGDQAVRESIEAARTGLAAAAHRIPRCSSAIWKSPSGPIDVKLLITP